MNSMHAFFAFGSFLAPLVSTPFLSKQVREGVANITETDPDTNEPDVTQITELYPMAGAALLLWSCGYLVQGIQKVARRRKARQDQDEEDTPRGQAPVIHYTRTKKVMLSIIFLFMIIYMGLEFNNFNYIPTFGVESGYRLSKADGAKMMALYLGCYSLSRVVGSFLAFVLPAKFILVANGFFVVSGNLMLLIAADTNLTLTHVGFGLTGFGMGSTFANMLMWLESYMTVGSKVATLMIAGCGIGVNIAPLTVGQFIKENAMIAIYLQTVSLFYLH